MKYQKKIEHQSANCAAFGCELIGTISSGTDGTAKFYCRFHYGKKPPQNDQTTLRVKTNLKLRNLFDMCITPELFFKGNNGETIFQIADKVINQELIDMGLSNIHVLNNLRKTMSNIIKEIDNRMVIKEISDIDINRIIGR